jgi:SAM-dependent methyltransferase
MTSSMSAKDWDERYRDRELVWGAAPNMWVEREVTPLAPGRALDLACGEGRNSVWLARQGWGVTGVDFSAEAIGKARALAEQQLGEADSVEWICANATSLELPAQYDLVLLAYLQLPESERRAALASAWSALGSGGTLLVIAHDSDNLAHGVGGPQDPAVLYGAQDVCGDILALDPDARIETSERVLRPVEGSERPAVDALFRAVKSP